MSPQLGFNPASAFPPISDPFTLPSDRFTFTLPIGPSAQSLSTPTAAQQSLITASDSTFITGQTEAGTLPIANTPNPGFVPKTSNILSASSTTSTPSESVSPSNLRGTSQITDILPTASQNLVTTMTSTWSTTGPITKPSTSLHTQNRVVPLAISISIVLICLCIVGLCVRRRKARKQLSPWIREAVAGLDGWKENRPFIDDQTVTPFDVSRSMTTVASPPPRHGKQAGAHHRGIVTTPPRSKRSRAQRFMRSLRRNHSNTTCVRRERTERLNTSTTPISTSSPNRAAQMGADAAVTPKRPIPGLNGVSSDSNVSPLLTGREEEMETLRGRLRVVENIALSLSDHTSRTHDVSRDTLERELRELIPPPKYTQD